ncbi:glycosyltransferase [bacterium SCSIO 12741]|nr:glycosyltransferase [bacterium SCSIO 12741]
MAKVLFLTTQLPFPPESGGVLKSWNLVKALAAHHELGMVTLLKGKDERHEAEFRKQVEIRDYQSYPCDNPRNLKTVVNSYLRSRTLNIYRNYSPQAKAGIEQLAASYDLLIADHYEMFQYVPANFKGRVILHEHNAEYVMWDRFASVENNLLRKNVLFLESRRIKNAEKQYCRRADRIWAAPNDQQALQKLGIPAQKFATTYHLGNDALLQEPDLIFKQTELNLAFIGTLSWEANIDGVIHFLKNIFPKILDKKPETTFTIIGKDADSRLKKAASPYGNQVVFTGFVPELEPWLSKARVFVLPLRFGSGMKVKFLDAMYRGIPVVSTPVGAEGLEVRHEKEAMITADPVQFAEACLLLLEDTEKWNEMSQVSRQLARDRYTWKAHLQDLMNDIQTLLNS